MNTLPGQFVLLAAFAATLWSLMAAWRWSRGREASRPGALLGARLAAALLVAAFGLVVAAFLTDDFRYAAVAGNSSSDLPLLYKLSASWAGQEGSLLLWCTLAAALGLALARRSDPRPRALFVFQGTQIGLLGIALSQTPFARLDPIPPDGRGLNPLLQDPWMATHPPVVFLGYAAAALPFSLALAALWSDERDRWAGAALRWTLVTVLTLGAGILLGAFWAYEVLGWGGYWGWDPVENSSLIPWITAVALLHGLLVQRRTRSLARWNAALALGTFALVIYATFLTRSGVLSSVSVHSFPQGGILMPLAAYLGLLAGVAGVALVARRRTFAGEPLAATFDLSTVLTGTMGLLLVSGGVILLGTSWPILSMWFGEPASPKPGFYNRSNLPVWTLISALLVAAPLLGWRPIPFRRLARVSILPVATGLATLGWALLAGIRAPLSLGLMLFSGAALGSCLVRAARAMRTSPMKIGAPLAHVGMAMLFIGVLVSSIGERREQVELVPGESREALGGGLRFDGADGPGFLVTVDPEGAATPARLELVDVRGGQVQRKPAIVRRLRGDLYLSPIGVDRAPRLARRAVLRRGTPVDVDGVVLRFEGFGRGDHTQGMTVIARLTTEGGAVLEPTLTMAEGGTYAEPVVLPETGARLRLAGMRVESGEVLVEVMPAGAPVKLYVEASWKPGMNVLWGGALLLCLGTGVSLTRRLLAIGSEARARASARPRRARTGTLRPSHAAPE